MDYTKFIDDALIARGDMYFNMKSYSMAKSCYEQALAKLRRYSGDRSHPAHTAQYLQKRIRECSGR